MAAYAQTLGIIVFSSKQLFVVASSELGGMAAETLARCEGAARRRKA